MSEIEDTEGAETTLAAQVHRKKSSNDHDNESPLVKRQILNARIDNLKTQTLKFANEGGFEMNLEIPDSEDVKKTFRKLLSTIESRDKEIDVLQKTLDVVEEGLEREKLSRIEMQERLTESEHKITQLVSEANMAKVEVGQLRQQTSSLDFSKLLPPKPSSVPIIESKIELIELKETAELPNEEVAELFEEPDDMKEEREEVKVKEKFQMDLPEEPAIEDVEAEVSENNVEEMLSREPEVEEGPTDKEVRDIESESAFFKEDQSQPPSVRIDPDEAPIVVEKLETKPVITPDLLNEKLAAMQNAFDRKLIELAAKLKQELDAVRRRGFLSADLHDSHTTSTIEHTPPTSIIDPLSIPKTMNSFKEQPEVRGIMHVESKSAPFLMNTEKSSSFLEDESFCKSRDLSIKIISDNIVLDAVDVDTFVPVTSEQSAVTNEKNAVSHISIVDPQESNEIIPEISVSKSHSKELMVAPNPLLSYLLCIISRVKETIPGLKKSLREINEELLPSVDTSSFQDVMRLYSSQSSRGQKLYSMKAEIQSFEILCTSGMQCLPVDEDSNEIFTMSSSAFDDILSLKSEVNGMLYDLHKDTAEAIESITVGAVYIPETDPILITRSDADEIQLPAPSSNPSTEADSPSDITSKLPSLEDADLVDISSTLVPCDPSILHDANISPDENVVVMGKNDSDEIKSPSQTDILEQLKVFSYRVDLLEMNGARSDEIHKKVDIKLSDIQNVQEEVTNEIHQLKQEKDSSTLYKSTSKITPQSLLKPSLSAKEMWPALIPLVTRLVEDRARDLKDAVAIAPLGPSHITLEEVNDIEYDENTLKDMYKDFSLMKDELKSLRSHLVYMKDMIRRTIESIPQIVATSNDTSTAPDKRSNLLRTPSELKTSSAEPAGRASFTEDRILQLTSSLRSSMKDTSSNSMYDSDYATKHEMDLSKVAMLLKDVASDAKTNELLVKHLVFVTDEMTRERFIVSAKVDENTRGLIKLRKDTTDAHNHTNREIEWMKNRLHDRPHQQSIEQSSNGENDVSVATTKSLLCLSCGKATKMLREVRALSMQPEAFITPSLSPLLYRGTPDQHAILNDLRPYSHRIQTSPNSRPSESVVSDVIRPVYLQPLPGRKSEKASMVFNAKEELRGRE